MRYYLMEKNLINNNLQAFIQAVLLMLFLKKKTNFLNVLFHEK